MTNSNLQVGKCYREESAMGGFRYIKVSEVNGINIYGEVITCFDEYSRMSSYVDQGRWEKITLKEFKEVKENSIK
jgi:hypothetical protein